MKKIQKSLIFPAISLLLIATIYGSLSIVNLQKQTELLKNQNQNLVSKISSLDDFSKENEIKINQLSSQNKDLANNLNQVSKQTSGSNNFGTKPSSSSPEQIVITKTVTETINQPIETNQATITIENVGSYKVDLQSGDNALTVLKRASERNNFQLIYDTYSFGVFITGIGGINPTGNKYWAFYFNGSFSNVGASEQPMVKGDSIFWQLASF